MQSPTIMAFRKRLRFRGYKEISIKRKDIKNEFLYIVRAIEPLSETLVEAEYSVSRMMYAFK